MYSNLIKGQAFPLMVKVSSKPSCYKQFFTPKSQSLPIASSLNSVCLLYSYTTTAHVFDQKAHKVVNFVKPRKNSCGFQCKAMELSNLSNARSCFNGYRVTSSVHCSSILRVRSFSSSYIERVGEGDSAMRSGKELPWLKSSHKVRESNRLENWGNEKSNHSRLGSLKSFEKVSSASSWEELAGKLDKGEIAKTGNPSWEDSAERLEREKVKTAQPSWSDSAEAVSGKVSNHMVGNKENRDRLFGAAKGREIGYGYDGRNAHGREQVEDNEGEEELEVIDDPRWDTIKNRVRRIRGVNSRTERPEFQRWNKQENWGRKAWKEATESTLPKMAGEAVYGVGPVLAALSAKRREIYALYIQEGLDLSGNNKKKKDKKRFEKVLRMAQKIGLSIVEVSKHDLNMIVDNRPHQGLVLDASPLEMVKMLELDPVSPEREKGLLWVALDEVTDPQNLGAIIRSAYFFGASGVVLCAKNSAPLSGVVSKASAGSLELMELAYCKNMMQFLVSSAENGWRVLGGSVSSKAVSLNEVLPGEPTILVLGSEGTGLRPLVERSCTQLVQIPGNVPVNLSAGVSDNAEGEETNVEYSTEEFRSFLAVESLNVSVAAGVMLHHLIGNNCNNISHVGGESAAVLE